MDMVEALFLTPEQRLLTPYYEDEFATLYHGDCREILPLLGQFDLLCTDPPYGKVKGDFDNEWTNRPAMLASCREWLDAMVPCLKSNGTLYWFAWPSLAGRIEALLAENLHVLAHIVWCKPRSSAQTHSPEALRAPAPETERILMAEHYGSDNMARGESGYAAQCEESRRDVFAPIREYLVGELARSGWTREAVNAAWRTKYGGKGGMSAHWFGKSQWMIPTAAHYAWLRDLFNLSDCTEYLRKEYEELRKEYEELRRYFDMRTGDQKTDLWKFPIEMIQYGHPTLKPLALISYIIRLSCRPSGVVLDPFCGSGTTLIAAKSLGRKSVGIEIDERYCRIAAERLAGTTPPLFPAPAAPAKPRQDNLFTEDKNEG